VEFPDSETIRRRTTAFQRYFIQHFMTLYSSLPSTVQTSALSVAVRRRTCQSVNHVQPSTSASSQDIVISLRQYLSAAVSCAEVPLQLPASEYALTITPDHFYLIRRARLDGCDDPAGLARQILVDVASEAAAELARAFEYQVSHALLTLSLLYFTDGPRIYRFPLQSTPKCSCLTFSS